MHRRPALVVLSFIGALVITAACGSESRSPTGLKGDPITNPLGLLNVGDVISLNVNTNDPCVNPVYHGVRVVAVGTRSVIFEDTLNPKNGFNTTDYQNFAARFDTVIYPLDVAAFGDPTDIDKNGGRISIVFTRAVNELTAGGSTAYVGGFAFSRDAFPHTDNGRAASCPGSNQGEYFYALTPDPTGTINGNVRTKGFVDSITPPVLAHELQHIINFTRRLYVNNTAAFEEKWLDEGLAHVAEELLFYHDGLVSPRTNLDISALRANNTVRNAYNLDQAGNTTRYRQYLQGPNTASPYAPIDTLTTRGAAWNFLRYAADRLNATDSFGPGTGQTIAGAGDVVVSPTSAGSEYSIVVVNTSLVSGSVTNFTVKTSTPLAEGAVVSERVLLPAASSVPETALGEDVAFESRLRSRERSLAPLVAGARAWYASQGFSRAPGVAFSRSAIADVDNGVWYRLVNNASVGMANLQNVFGSDIAGLVRDWSVSQSVDDIAAPGTQYQQRSWNYHNVYANLGTGGNPYPLSVTTLASNTTVSGTILAGGSTFYRLTPAVNSSVTVNLSAPAGAVNPNLVMVVVKTK